MSGSVNRQAGFTLLESMMAAAMLAVGLLALAGMQTVSFGRNVDASELTRATNLAADIVERIQFNRRNVTAYHGINVSNATTTCPAVATNTMANGDCLQWRALLIDPRVGLPGVQGTVTLNPVPPATDPTGLNRSTVAVMVRWTGSINSEQSIQRTKVINLVTVIAPE